MYEQILHSLPPDPTGTLITLLVAVGIAVGAITALLGALHSRLTISLMMFSIGAVLGFVLPGWLGLDVNRSAMIPIGGVIFGMIGFLRHRFCVAIALAFLVAMVTLFILYDQTQPIDKVLAEGVQMEDTLPGTVFHAWDAAPDRFKVLAPWVGPGSFLAAGLLAILFPKIGMAALYSLGGTVIMLFSIKLGHASDNIHWLDLIKTGPMTIVALGMAMLLFGFLTQIALLFRSSPGSEAEQSKES